MRFGHGQCLTLVVGDKDDGHAEILVDMLDLQLHMLAQLLVERPQRFVHQHQFGVKDQRAGQSDALLLTARKLLRVAAGELPQTHHVQHLLHLGVDFRSRKLAHRQWKAQVLGDRHVWKQRVILKDHADVALVWRHLVDHLVTEADLAGSWRLEARQHHQTGRLARTRGPEQGEEFAAADVEVEVADNQRFAVVSLLRTAERNVRRITAAAAGNGLVPTPPPGSPLLHVGNRRLSATSGAARQNVRGTIDLRTLIGRKTTNFCQWCGAIAIAIADEEDAGADS